MTEWSLGLIIAFVIDFIIGFTAVKVGYKFWRKKREDNKQREPASPAG